MPNNRVNHIIDACLPINIFAFPSGSRKRGDCGECKWFDCLEQVEFGKVLQDIGDKGS